MSTFWQRKKNRIRLRELEDMKKDVSVVAHRIDSQLCSCTLRDIEAGRISSHCKTHEAAEMIYEVLRKYRKGD